VREEGQRPSRSIGARVKARFEQRTLHGHSLGRSECKLPRFGLAKFIEVDLWPLDEGRVGRLCPFLRGEGLVSYRLRVLSGMSKAYLYAELRGVAGRIAYLRARRPGQRGASISRDRHGDLGRGAPDSLTV